MKNYLSKIGACAMALPLAFSLACGKNYLEKHNLRQGEIRNGIKVGQGYFLSESDKPFGSADNIYYTDNRTGPMRTYIDVYNGELIIALMP